MNALSGPDATDEEKEALRRDALAASVGIGQEPSPLHFNRSDPLLSYGVEIDSAPYLYALQNVRAVAAGLDLTRIPQVDAPGEDLTHRWPVRAIRIVGTCMEPHLKDGEVALVLPPEAAVEGCFVTATVDLQFPVCKRIRINDKASWLEPTSGEGVIGEDRFIVTGVVANKITSMWPEGK